MRDENDEALAYLARSLSANPTNPAVLTRLRSVLALHSWFVPTATLRHAGRLLSAQFGPDGNVVVTGSDDGTARVWDAQTGQPLTEPFRHRGAILAVQISPDGQRIVTASEDATARVWHAQTGQPLITSRG